MQSWLGYCLCCRTGLAKEHAGWAVLIHEGEKIRHGLIKGKYRDIRMRFGIFFQV